MDFVSLDFFIFFSIICVLYQLTCKMNLQNLVLLAGSYFFYGYWDHRFLTLILFVSLVSFFSAIFIEASTTKTQRKAVLVASIALLLSPLFLFKYYDFFIASLNSVVSADINSQKFDTLNAILPVGISFYTFQAVAYISDVFRNRIPPEKDALKYFTFISFFPQLVAGPIERAEHLLPQFKHEKHISLDNVTEGFSIALYGYIMKICFADSVAPYANMAFSPDNTNGFTFILGSFIFGLQIYGDFYGYSLIAKGAAKILGIDLVWNFKQPYLSTSIIQFWRTWHVSLGRWLKDYLYIPLGGNRCRYPRQVLNILITMALAGLWHGASCNFLVWGLWLGIWLALWHAWEKFTGRPVPALLGWPLNFLIVMCGWTLFRINDMAQLHTILDSLGSMLAWFPVHTEMLRLFVGLFGTILFIETLQRRFGDRLFLRRFPRFSRLILFPASILLLVLLQNRTQENFIYFQF